MERVDDMNILDTLSETEDRAAAQGKSSGEL
jgi:hypothetical protein